MHGRCLKIEKYCKCGCGVKITIQAHHKYVGIPDFIRGHSLRVRSDEDLKRLSQKAKERTMRGDNEHFIGYWKGKKRSKDQKKKQSIKMSGGNHPFFGIKRPVHSLKMKEIYQQKDNHAFKLPEMRNKAKLKHPDFSGENNPRYIDGRNSDPAYLASKTNKRRALKIKLMPSSADQSKILEIYKKCRKMNKRYPLGRGIAAFHVDHIIPLSKGGLHHECNLRIITSKENLMKHNKFLATEDV